MSSTDKRTRRAASHSKSPYVPIADGVLGKLFLVVADATDLITDLRVESLLLGAKNGAESHRTTSLGYAHST